MKKTTAVASILSLSAIFALTTLNVFAENDNNDNGRDVNKQSLGGASFNGEQSNKQERNGRKNEMRSNHDEQESEMDNESEDDTAEISLHDHVSKAPDSKVAVTLPDVSSTTITTYADVISVLNQYQNAIKTINTNGTLGSIASSTLSTQEQTLLRKLMNKYTGDFNRLNARANDLSSQIKDIIDVLTPLGTTTITSSLNLKNLILSQLKDFAGAINDLKDLGDTSVDIIEQETN